MLHHSATPPINLTAFNTVNLLAPIDLATAEMDAPPFNRFLACSTHSPINYDLLNSSASPRSHHPGACLMAVAERGSIRGGAPWLMPQLDALADHAAIASSGVVSGASF